MTDENIQPTDDSVTPPVIPTGAEESLPQLSELDTAKQERDEYKNNWLRALADYQNLQKETVARRVEWAQMSERQILEEFIPIYEHLKLAISNKQNKQSAGEDSWTDGIKNVIKQFQSVLKEHGVEEIKTVGEKFNPNLHEAAGHETVEGAGEDEIVKEISGGYKMGDKVIKAAKVIVAK
ncbi:MAG: nucleotide exchange factor GrpE [Candidatus Magasanikbacteria bacterium CG10_big_fil_rev_8_21_14_0_10_36_32]|uniref:Protein GrpE n=1 Tax=Candidatus Magasanikbacteria bacterium CG10_big_fil_rev_8_21_14_0_10_36_32 TaxID=1974646 RepID=A0A2M6W618_9BACT|nr:MAG: nucleotide exchange factor GrpE [Candidatus Magasanikbacteria bacterium CG10_big_fil_rev_8_21_14_0_10_36_32]